MQCAIRFARKLNQVPRAVQTLADMIESEIAGMLESVHRLLILREAARARLNNPMLPGIEGEFSDFPEVLVECLKDFQKSHLSRSRDAVSWAMYQTDEGKKANAFAVYQYADNIYSVLVMETASEQFFKLVHPEYYSRIDDPERRKMFGEKVEQSFPSTVKEIIGACNCFALEEWTASVFHCMRILECPLTLLAKKFGVPYERAEWHNMIEGIESKVRVIDQDYGVKWKDDQKFFGEAARHFMFLKNGWRNHVMHVRDEYDEGMALSILQHTKEFTSHLSARLSETP